MCFVKISLYIDDATTVLPVLTFYSELKEGILASNFLNVRTVSTVLRSWFLFTWRVHARNPRVHYQYRDIYIIIALANIPWLPVLPGWEYLIVTGTDQLPSTGYKDVWWSPNEWEGFFRCDRSARPCGTITQILGCLWDTIVLMMTEWCA